MQQETLIIIGSGPAGLTAAIYAARANLNPLLIAGNQMGGQIAITNEVENFPGFDTILGPELTEKMRVQAEHFGTRFEFDEVLEVDFTKGPPFYLKTYGQEYQAQSVIVATGASARRLGIPGEEALIGRGVSYCATCDGFFFRNKELVVVGGGDSALEETMFLTKFASKIRVVHRRDHLRAGPTLQRRALAHPKIEFVWNSVVTAISGEAKLESLTLKNLVTGEISDLPADGLFVYIGHLPNNQLFLGKLATDELGYLVTDKRMRTSVPGVFAAGEIQDHRFRQIATSVGQGVAAAMEAEKYLASLEDRSYPEAAEERQLTPVLAS
jgi:thioredoxin reductase (NADPH)